MERPNLEWFLGRIHVGRVIMAISATLNYKLSLELYKINSFFFFFCINRKTIRDVNYMLIKLIMYDKFDLKKYWKFSCTLTKLPLSLLRGS